jgi:K+-transporting ATPase A subunit
MVQATRLCVCVCVCVCVFRVVRNQAMGATVCKETGRLEGLEERVGGNESTVQLTLTVASLRGKLTGSSHSARMAAFLLRNAM